MATKRVDFVVSEKGTAKTKAGLKGVDKQLLSMAKSAISVGVAMAAIRKAAELTKLAADATNVERAFRNLSKEPDKMLQAMKKAVGGTIQEFDLMKQFNQAALLGLPLDRFDEMLAIARSSAQATGQSMDFMLNSIVTGIGRQSRLMIDNLGLIVSIGDANEVYAQQLGKLASELTQVEQKTAFANAVLKAGAENIEKMGGKAEGAFDGFNKLTSIIKDKTIDVFKNLVSPVDTAAESLANFMTIAEQGALTQDERNQKLMKDDFARAMLMIKQRKAMMALYDAEKLRDDAAKLRADADIFALVVGEQTHSSLRTTAEDNVKLAMAINKVKREAAALMVIQHGEIALLPEITLATNDLTTAQHDLAAASLESGLKGLAMSQNLGDASRALAQQYIVEGVFGAVKSALVEVPFPWNLIAAGSAGIAANALFQSVMPAATGADFTTSGPQLMLVGEAGREHVSVTPLEGPNINGPQGGNTFIFNGDIIGTDDYIENNLIPAVNLAITQGRAALA
jgi:hypothetical protein